MNTRHLIVSHMRRRDFDECAELSVQAFADYEYFTHFYPDRDERLQFMRAMIRSEYRTTRRLAPDRERLPQRHPAPVVRRLRGRHPHRLHRRGYRRLAQISRTNMPTKPYQVRGFLLKTEPPSGPHQGVIRASSGCYQGVIL